MDLGFIGGFKALSGEYCKLPFEIIWANEINPYACRTYRRNIGFQGLQVLGVEQVESLLFVLFHGEISPKGMKEITHP